VSLDPQLVTAIGATCVAGYMMTVVGLKKNGLEWRRRRWTCPSCGRDHAVCTCA